VDVKFCNWILALNARRVALISGLVIILFGGILPMFNQGNVLAAYVTQRSVTIGSSIPSAVTTYNFSFVPATSGPIQSMEFQACTTALGTCTAPSGLSFSSTSGGSVSGGWTNSTAFTVDNTGSNNCTAASNELCVKRTQSASETNSGNHVINFSNITNPNGTSCSTSNCTFFVRISTFSDNTYSTLVDSGTVASSTTQILTVSATVAEQLSFCIGNTSVNDATTTVLTCPSITGTSVNLGTLSSTAVSVSPVASTNYNGNGDNGLAELTTNASNGATVAYNAIQQSGTNHLGTLRVAGATCNSGSVNTDQCINTIGTTKATLTAGTEDFGMTIAGINCSVISGYTCSFASGTFNLDPATNYNCNGTANAGHSNTYPTADTNQVTGTTTCSYAWDESGTTNTIASSSTIVGDEALILKFAATPNIVTPTGAYTAQADFIATPTF
jgi:hypothetical protein